MTDDLLADWHTPPPGMVAVDVTEHMTFNSGDMDGEALPIGGCLCGAKWSPWNGPILSVYPGHPKECPNCHRLFYFTVSVRVMEVRPGA